MFPRAFERIGVGFYRSKITSWMAAQEEDYRCIPDSSHCAWTSAAPAAMLVPACLQLLLVPWFLDCTTGPKRGAYANEGVVVSRFIILEADGEMSPWSRLCVSQADCVLLVAAPDASPEVCPDTNTTVWPCLLRCVVSCAAMCIRELRTVAVSCD